jgi:hypothetical protein
MQRQNVGAYWNFYDAQTRQLLEDGRLVRGTSWPTVGQMIVGVPGKPSAIVKDFSTKGTKDGLPCYDVYI